MNTLINKVIKAEYKKGYIYILMKSGVELKFPIENNKRLSQATNKKLSNIEISPFGLHWPELDEDLSFHGLLKGDFGQYNVNNSQLA
ncbi:MAG: DUF2442 domain-containing protein [Candidatus Marinimicrobia bacterium]|nr:DUF2442 domain-containing protein [Candidatus Neomarinimicrobiota bacterium]